MFLREMFSEPTGQGSSNRVCVVAIIAILLACLVRLVMVCNKFPDVPESLVNLVEWVLSALLFGNVVKNGINAWQNVKGGGNVPDA